MSRRGRYEAGDGSGDCLRGRSCTKQELAAEKSTENIRPERARRLTHSALDGWLWPIMITGCAAHPDNRATVTALLAHARTPIGDRDLTAAYTVSTSTPLPLSHTC